MSEAVVETPRGGSARAAVAERWFALGVGACTAGVALFLSLRLTAWPPHEDETLALFIGRKRLDGVLGTVLNQRGGAPLHFLFAWAVAHLGGGLVALRAVSAVFAVASVPLCALLSARLAGRAVALTTTVLLSASWMLLFHGVYGRMYSIFLVTSVLSFLALLRAIERGGLRQLGAVGRRRCCSASHRIPTARSCSPRGSRTRRRCAHVCVRRRSPSAPLLVLGIPFWRTDLVLAGRFDVGVGGGGEKGSARRSTSSATYGPRSATSRPATRRCSSSSPCSGSSGRSSSSERTGGACCSSLP